MTASEQASINKVQLKQATMEANQNNMAEDIQEMKSDIKEIKHILQAQEGRYVSKGVVKYFVGLIVSIATAAIFFWDHITRSH